MHPMRFHVSGSARRFLQFWISDLPMLLNEDSTSARWRWPKSRELGWEEGEENKKETGRSRDAKADQGISVCSSVLSSS